MGRQMPQASPWLRACPDVTQQTAPKTQNNNRTVGRKKTLITVDLRVLALKVCV